MSSERLNSKYFLPFLASHYDKLEEVHENTIFKERVLPLIPPPI